MGRPTDRKKRTLPNVLHGISCVRIVCSPHISQVLLEVWGESDSLEGLREVLAAYPQEEKDKWGGPDQVRAVEVAEACAQALGHAPQVLACLSANCIALHSVRPCTPSCRSPSSSLWRRGATHTRCRSRWR